MPRDSQGNYTLPPGNPVASGTIISPGWANPTCNDIAAELTNSLDRNGRGGMLVAFLNVDGTVAQPGLTFTNEPSTGLYRAGNADVRMSIGGNDAWRTVDASGQPAGSQEPLEVWNGSAWVKVATAGIVPDLSSPPPIGDVTPNSVAATNIVIEGTEPSLKFLQTDALPDEQYWEIKTNLSAFAVRALTDSGSSGPSALLISRNGNTVEKIELGSSVANARVRAFGPLSLFAPSGAPTDERDWELESTGGNFIIKSRTDAGGTGSNALQISRSGTTVDSIELGNNTDNTSIIAYGPLRAGRNSGQYIELGGDAGANTITTHAASSKNVLFNIDDFAGLYRFSVLGKSAVDIGTRSAEAGTPGLVRIYRNAAAGYWEFHAGENGVSTNLLINYSGSDIGQFNSNTGAYTTISLREYKDNIAPLTSAIDIIKQLKPSTYEMSGTPSAGYIYDEVEPVLPLAAVKDDTGKGVGVDHNIINVYLMKTVQELIARVEELETH